MENKRPRGRQKIDMKKREKEEERFVTFSKRRAGLYKKASELCIICDADIGIFIFSPTGKPFSFSHPSMESIANRFLFRNYHPNDNASQLVEARCRGRVNELIRKLNDQSDRAEAEKEREKMLACNKKARGDRDWFDASIRDRLSKEEVEKLSARLSQVQLTLCKRMNEVGGMGASSSSSGSAAYPKNAGPIQGPSATARPRPN